MNEARAYIQGRDKWVVLPYYCHRATDANNNVYILCRSPMNLHLTTLVKSTNSTCTTFMKPPNPIPCWWSHTQNAILLWTATWWSCALCDCVGLGLLFVFQCWVEADSKNASSYENVLLNVYIPDKINIGSYVFSNYWLWTTIWCTLTLSWLC